MYNDLFKHAAACVFSTSCNDGLIAVMHNPVQMPEALQWLKARPNGYSDR